MIYFDNQRSMVNFINGIEKDIMETFESYKSMEGIQIGHLEDLYHELEMLFHQRNETKVLLEKEEYICGYITSVPEEALGNDEIAALAVLIDNNEE